MIQIWQWLAENKVQLESISAIATALGVLGAVAGFWFAIIQYRRAEQWKRAEYLVGLYDEFLKDIHVVKAMQILDWRKRRISFVVHGKSKIFVCSTENLIGALGKKKHYEPLEVHIRDTFDGFLGYLEDFELAIQGKLISQDEVYPYLKYWIAMLLGKKHLPPAATTALRSYMKEYEFLNALALIDRFEKY